MSADRRDPSAPRRAAAPASAEQRRARALEGLGLDGGSRGPPEAWAVLAFGMLALLVAAVFYLGTRPGGRAPIWVYVHGRHWLALGALLLLGVGLVWSARRGPFLQRRRGRAFLSLVLVIGVAPFPMPYPSSREGRSSSVVFRLPVDGEWIVAQGGERREDNLFAAMTHDRRWALALVPPSEPGAGRGAARSPGESPAWGRPVLAAAAGRVVRVRDGVGDLTELGRTRPDAPPLGNLVVLEVAPDEYLFTCHLREGSVAVAVGQQVSAGDVLGAVGFSGRFTFVREPHVAVHLQDTPDDFWGEAIPWHLCDYEADGRPVARGLPRGGGATPSAGQRVRPGGGPGARKAGRGA